VLKTLNPLFRKKIGEEMNTNAKEWSLTWEPNIAQKKIPDEDVLMDFLDRISIDHTFQYEIGSKKGKEHIQGTFTLIGPRQSKKSTLDLFRERFKNVSGLTLSPVHDRFAINAYVTKDEGRTRGPFYGGKNNCFDTNMAKTPLRHWQKKLFEFLTSDELPKLKDRKVIWVEDTQGNTGKSWFRKWLDVGQNVINVKPLPVSNVDRLMSAVNIISKTNKVDVYTIDLTRTRGENESFKDLFSAIEQIKNGYVVDVMYGKFNRAIFDPPVVIIFTNEPLYDHDRKIDYLKYLSEDRWLRLIIQNEELIHRDIKGNENLIDKKQKSDFGQRPTNQSQDDFMFMNEEKQDFKDNLVLYTILSLKCK
jgi:hypothetical protein